MFNSLVLNWGRNFEVTFGVFSVLVAQINVCESFFRHMRLRKYQMSLQNLFPTSKLFEVSAKLYFVEISLREVMDF